MRYLKIFVSAILAGLCIAIGGLIFLVCAYNNLKILGGILFSIGLMTICICGFHLYTGKIGYAFENKKNYILDLLIILFGNIVGAVALGYLISLTSLCFDKSSVDSFFTFATNLATGKLIAFDGSFGQTWYSALILSFFCGILVFLAVDIYKKATHYFVKIIGVIACVSAFVICGFEHCVADMFYFAIANSYGVHFGESVVTLLVIVFGNSIGAFAIWGAIKFINFNIKNPGAIDKD